jgi:hypothetical protein
MYGGKLVDRNKLELAETPSGSKYYRLKEDVKIQYQPTIEKYFKENPDAYHSVMDRAYTVKGYPEKITQEVFKFLNVDSSFIPNTSKKANVSGVPKGTLGWIIMKLRKKNLMPNIEFSKIYPEFIVNLILNTIYSKPKKISNKLIKKLTKQYYIKDIRKLEKLINKDLSIWM